MRRDKGHLPYTTSKHDCRSRSDRKGSGADVSSLLQGLLFKSCKRCNEVFQATGVHLTSFHDVASPLGQQLLVELQYLVKRSLVHIQGRQSCTQQCRLLVELGPLKSSDEHRSL